MSRTPLFALLRRSLSLARFSNTSGRSAAEVVERWTETARLARAQAISRREFVAFTAAGVAAVSLNGCATVAGAGRRTREPVVIVGAGIAGLTAAYRLRQAGVPVRVFEAQNRVGGRMLSLRDYFADGQVVELGGELIDTGHDTIQALAAELGIELNDLTQDDAAMASTWYFEGVRRSEAEVVEAFRPVARRIEADLATLTADDVTYDAPAGAERFDHMSVSEWLDRADVSGWFRRLLDVAYTTEYGLEVDRQSALNFLLMISPNPDEFQVFGDSDERFHVRGGNDLIVQRVAARVEDAIETGAVLEAVRSRGDGGFVCTFRRGESSFEVEAGHLVLAIPFTLLRGVRLDVELPPVQRRAIRELGYGTNAKLMVGFSERVWRARHGGNGTVVTDLPFQLTWETSRLQAGGAGVLTNFSGGDHGVAVGQGTPAEQAARLVAELERVFPGIANTRAGMREARFHWPSHPWTRGSYASYLTGQWTAFRGAEGAPAGRLYFAGEHCSLEAQGFMEGGCETGQAAAQAILASLGVRRRASQARERAPAVA